MRVLHWQNALQAIIFIVISTTIRAQDEASDFTIPRLRGKTASIQEDENEEQMVMKVPCSLRLKDQLPPEEPHTESAVTVEHINGMKTAYKGSKVRCAAGYADGYGCRGVNILSLLDTSALNAVIGASKSARDELNDVWGWTDDASGREFALVGLVRGTAFVEVTDPINPIYLGVLPKHKDKSSGWSDIKTYKNYAYIVSEASNHGLQIFNMKQLLTVKSPKKFKEKFHYDEFGNSHNLFINEESGFLYAVGTNKCRGGLHMAKLKNNQEKPVFAGCFSEDGYTHDVQCVIYRGNDKRYTGNEICFASNEDTLTIVDVSNKKSPKLLSKSKYKKVGYTHQGWLTDNHDFFVFDDESDERRENFKTRTLVYNVKNLKAPKFAGQHFGQTKAIDHNQYVRGNFVYQANYRAGLQVLKIKDISKAKFEQVGLLDTFISSDSPNFNGAWSVYPFFKSNTVLISSIEQGLFLVEVDADSNRCAAFGESCSANNDCCSKSCNQNKGKCI